MRNDHHTILQLVALGRITPNEAERLLMAWNDGRETFWALAACIAVSLGMQVDLQHWLQQWLPKLLQTAHSMLPALGPAVHHALATVTQLLGGIL